MLEIFNLIKLSPAIQMTAIRKGLNAKEAERLVEDYQLGVADIAEFLGLTPRSLLFRFLHDFQLDSVASERLLRLARIANHAKTIFGTPIAVGDWLTRPHSALNQATPLSMLDTAYGEQEVERILCSIEYGLPV